MTGQDGAYLSELLLQKATSSTHQTTVVVFNTGRIEHLYQDPHVLDQRFVLHYAT